MVLNPILFIIFIALTASVSGYLMTAGRWYLQKGAKALFPMPLSIVIFSNHVFLSLLCITIRIMSLMYRSNALGLQKLKRGLICDRKAHPFPFFPTSGCSHTELFLGKF